ncbi:MAG: hypothetical protein ACRC5C_14175, partial [Bacilli bacterium]
MMNKKQIAQAFLVGALVVSGVGAPYIASAKTSGKVKMTQKNSIQWPSFKDVAFQKQFDKELATFKKEVAQLTGVVSIQEVKGNLGYVTYVFKQKEVNKPERVIRTIIVDTQSKQIVPNAGFIMTEAFTQDLFKELVEKTIKANKLQGVKALDEKTPFALQYDAKTEESSYLFYVNTEKGIVTVELKEADVASVPVPIVCDPLLVVPYLFEAN